MTRHAGVTALAVLSAAQSLDPRWCPAPVRARVGSSPPSARRTTTAVKVHGTKMTWARSQNRAGHITAWGEIATGPSALTHSEDLHWACGLCYASGHGTDGLSLGLGRGSPALGGDPGRSQPAAEACGAGPDHPALGRAAGRGGGRPAGRDQPAGGLALAAALRRGRRRRAVARQDQEARQAAARPRPWCSGWWR